MFRSITALVIGLVATSFAYADLGPIIDFEDAAVQTPGGDDAFVSTQYFESHGVTFSLMAGPTKQTAVPGFPTYEAVGHSAAEDTPGFLYGASFGGAEEFDVEAPPVAGGLGDFFLKSTNSVTGTGYVKLIIDYAYAVNAAAGQIWDIDGRIDLPEGTEQWEVFAYDESGNLLASILSPDSGQLSPEAFDGLPWDWAFNVPGIRKIEIEFCGTKTNYVGLAFDNFTPAVPEPASLALMGLAGLFLRRR